jgi:hypothetical protein
MATGGPGSPAIMSRPSDKACNRFFQKIIEVPEKAVAYIRVSSATQLDGYGLEAQERDVRKCAKAHGVKLAAVQGLKGAGPKTGPFLLLSLQPRVSVRPLSAPCA